MHTLHPSTTNCALAAAMALLQHPGSLPPSKPSNRNLNSAVHCTGLSTIEDKSIFTEKACSREGMTFAQRQASPPDRHRGHDTNTALTLPSRPVSCAHTPLRVHPVKRVAQFWRHYA